MKEYKSRASKMVAFLLVLMMIVPAFSSCDKTIAESSDTSVTAVTENSVKTKIDSLYVSELSKEKEKVDISTRKSYSTSGDVNINAASILTDGIYGDDVATSGKWAAFDYKSGVSITVEFGIVTEGITSFTFDAMQLITDRVFLPDEVRVSASLDGIEFIDVGVMIRDKTEDDNASSMYNLTLSGAIKASHIRFTPISDKTGSTYIDEVCIYAYGTEAVSDELYTYDSFYGAKMPDEVTTPVYWDESEADYVQSQNLVLGRTPSVFTMNVDVVAASTSPVSDLYKITDGTFATSTSFSDEAFFKSYSAYANTDARLFVFDLEKTSAITGFKTTFANFSSAGVSMPESYSVYTSENGKTWDVVYRRDGIRNGGSPENALVSIEGSFDKSYCSRFVAVFFDIEGNTRFDEIEIFGTKSITNAEPVSETGDTKMMVGEYPQSEDVLGVQDALLLYHCYSNTIDGLNPVIGGFTEEECMKWIGYYDRDGNITDYYFNTFMFLGGGQTTDWNKAVLWQTYFDNVFSDDYNVDALNSAAAKVGEALGNSEYKAKVMFTLFLPSAKFTDFGDLDGDGKAEDLTTLAGKQKVMDWQINKYIERFNEGQYANLELVGFYWHDEVIRYDDATLPAAMRYSTDLAHENGYIMMCCPYFLASGFYDWYNLGFDLSIYQPSYYFWNNNEAAIPKTAAMAKALGYGVEMEVEADAITEIEMLERYVGYLKGGVDYGYMDAVHMYYYSKPYYESCNAANWLGRQLYELNYQFVKGTLKFSTAEAVYDVAIVCKSNDSISEKLKIEGISYELLSSTKYGTLKFTTDGRFSYKPAEGFVGEDQFFVKVMTTGADTVYYEIKIDVKND